MTPGTWPCQATGAPAFGCGRRAESRRWEGRVDGRQSSRGSWDTCPSDSLCVLLTRLCLLVRTTEEQVAPLPRLPPTLSGMGSAQWEPHPACHLFHFGFWLWNSSRSDYGMFARGDVGMGTGLHSVRSHTQYGDLVGVR